MNHEENKRRVDLEDLLQLKRAERPSPEFWVTFERELRAKQLAAIVAKRPWWRTVPSTFSGVLRYRLPLGVATVLAFTFLSVHEYQLVAVAKDHHSSPVMVAVQADPMPQAVSAVQKPDSPDALAVSSQPVVARERLVAISNSAPVASNEEAHGGSMASAGGTEELSPAVPLLVAAEQPESGDLSPTARSIADNLAAAKEAHPELISRVFGAVSNFEKRALPAPRQVVDPLAQMRNPADLHRERLLASADPVAVAMAGHTSERLARRISDERLTEEAISRFDARGDRLLVKF